MAAGVADNGPMPTWLAGALVFFTSGSVLVLEILAGRLLRGRGRSGPAGNTSKLVLHLHHAMM